jgi:hypothetical protein
MEALTTLVDDMQIRLASAEGKLDAQAASSEIVG